MAECITHRGTELQPVTEDRTCATCGVTTSKVIAYECVVVTCPHRYDAEGRWIEPAPPTPKAKPVPAAEAAKPKKLNKPVLDEPAV